MISRLKSKSKSDFKDVSPNEASQSFSLVAERFGSRLSTIIKPDPGSSDTKSSTGGGGILFKSFLFLVVLPVFATLLYASLWASDVYVVESKMTVREALDPSSSQSSLGSSSTSSLLSSLGLSGSTGTAQDTLIVLDYLKSRAVIEAIGGRDAMNRYYNASDVDYLSRLGEEQDIETLWTFWRSRVTASVDTLSNILTVKVAAYSARDALELSNAILKSSEALINQISERNRQDALARANAEVESSISSMAAARAQLSDFQKQNNTLDPVESAKELTKLISSLTVKKIELESFVAASDMTRTSDTPAYRFSKTQLDVLNAQIDKLKLSLTGGAETNTISQQLKEFEILKLRYSFAEQVYKLARSSFEDARRKFSRQQLYAVVVVPPLLPEEPTYPRPLIDSLLVFAGAFVLWAIMALIAVGIKDST